MYKISHLLKSIISNFLFEYVVFLVKCWWAPNRRGPPLPPWCLGPSAGPGGGRPSCNAPPLQPPPGARGGGDKFNEGPTRNTNREYQ